MKRKVLTKLQLSVTILALFLCTFLKPIPSFASDSLGTWTQTSNLPYSIASHSSYAYGGKVFVVGGANNIVNPTNISNSINNDGFLNAWSSSPSSSPYVFYQASAIKNGITYILGGATYPPFQSSDSVFMGVVDRSGVINSWITLNPLPKKLSLGAAAIVKNRIYFAGGFNNQETSQNIYSAAINADGTIGSWSDAGMLPTPDNGFSMIESGNHIIVLGGSIPGGFSAKTYTTAVNDDGSIAGWTETTALPEPIYRGQMARIGSTIVSAGGINSPDGSISDHVLNKIYYASINQNGSLGTWSLSQNHLPQPVAAGSIAVSDNFLYITGGFNGQYLDTVYFSKFITRKDLNVPVLRQTSEPWQSLKYDSADKWNPADITINRWGCALTSAAMVLQYYGITKFSDGTPLDPGSLNSWLESQPDGYVGGGLVNWIALSRLSKRLSPINNVTAFDALEFSRNNSSDNAQLTSDINNSQPDILEEPGHFVLAKGINDTTFDINDPYYSDRNTLQDGYKNTFSSLLHYSPSFTNLSYIMLSVDPNADLLITGPDQKQTGSDTTTSFSDIPNAEYYTQNGITSPDINGTISTSSAEKIFLLPKANAGTYSVSVNSNSTTAQNEKFTIYEYDTSGNATTTAYNPVVKKNHSALYQFTYSQTANPQSAPIDNTKPKMTGAKTIDSDQNGKLDQIQITFSKDLNGSTVTNNDFSINGYSLRTDKSAAENNGAVTLYLVEKTVNDTGQTPTVTIADHGVEDFPDGNWNNAQTITPIDSASPISPSANITAGDYLSQQSIILSSSDNPNTPDIFYSLDNSDPDSATASAYTAPISLSTDTTIRAIAKDLAGNVSSISAFSYRIAPTITDISQTNSASALSISWKTNYASTSRVVYDTTSRKILSSGTNYGYSYSTLENSANATDHAENIANLSPSTYYYRVISKGSIEQVSEEQIITLADSSSGTLSNAILTTSISSTSDTPASSSCNDQKPGSSPVITAAIPGLNQITLFWQEAADPVTYYLLSYGEQSGNPTYGNPNIGDRNTRSYTVNNLSGAATYYFQVRAVNGCEPGDFSNEVAAIPFGALALNQTDNNSNAVLGKSTQNNEKNKAPQKSLTIASVKTDGSKWYIKLGSMILFLSLLFAGYRHLGGKTKSAKFF